MLLYLTLIALEVKANCCLCLLPPSAVPGEVPISPLVHVPATVVLISKLATPLFECYLGRSHREPWTGFTADCMYRKPLGFGESLAYVYWLFFLQEGSVRVCGIAVLGYFWCGVAVIFISKYGIAVFRVQAVCGEFEFYVAVVGEKIVVLR